MICEDFAKEAVVRTTLNTVYPLCTSFLPPGFDCLPQNLPEKLREQPELVVNAPFLADLARVELAAYDLSTQPATLPTVIIQRMVRPDLELIEVGWQGLPELIAGRQIIPAKEPGFVLLVPNDRDNSIRVITPSNHDLLALKIVAEKMTSSEAAREAQVSIGIIDNILYMAEQKGLLLKPDSKIVRPDGFCKNHPVDQELLSSPSFTLQWHITQACDLNCRHCYDRTNRTTVTVIQGIHVLDDFYQFCEHHHVYGQVSFSGGNPMLSPHFFHLYREAVERGFLTAVLGNPMDQSHLERMVAVKSPDFFQVSLEGLREHNDSMRGIGHFDRTLNFLALLKEMNIYSMVMLTLTRANQNQVLPLAELLRGKTDLFTFNRLAMVGEGAALESVAPENYRIFLDRFQRAAENNAHLSLKDNFFNLLNHQRGTPLKGGCTGFGCGAAFNFLSLLPDGEVHACRKLPSLLGNIYENSLTDIYHSPISEHYRRGISACSDCEIRAGCRGCPAVTFGYGLDVFSEVDPYCFKENITA